MAKKVVEIKLGLKKHAKLTGSVKGFNRVRFHPKTVFRSVVQLFTSWN